jgi:hypothetical protein
MDSISKLNDKIIKFLAQPLIKYGFLALVVIQIIFINQVNTSYLEFYDLWYTKVIAAFLIAYYACFDPIYSIALTTLLIISIQELHRRRATTAMRMMPSVSKVTTTSSPDALVGEAPFITTEKAQQIAQQAVKYVGTEGGSRESVYLVNDANTFNEINKQSLQKVPLEGDKLVAEYDFYEDPAYQTLTANLSNNQILGRNRFMVTDYDLAVAQTNELSTGKLGSAQVFDAEMNNIQGLPMGFEKSN